MGTTMFSTLLISLTSFVVLVLTQPSPPTEGVQVGDVLNGIDVRFPLAVSQCEPIIIYYNVTQPPVNLYILTPDRIRMFNFILLAGAGYMEWICDIPAGDSFIIECNLERGYVVQSGSSSSCLHNITKTYPYASINTSAFRSYTQNPSNTSPSVDIPFLATGTISYPTDSLPTITINPELAIPSATSLSPPATTTLPSSSVTHTNSSSWSATSSIVISSTTASPPRPHKSKTPVIVGGIIGGTTTILLIFCMIFCHIRRRRNSQLEIATMTSQPLEHSRLTTMPASEGITSDAVASTFDWNPLSLFSEAQPLVTPFMASKPDPASLLFNQETPPTLESPDPQSNLTAAVDTTSPLQPDARQPLFIGTTDVAPPPQTQPMSPLSAGPQNDPSNMITALNALSRLDPMERRMLVSSLHNVITSAASPPPESLGSARAPPSYNG